MVTLPNSKSLPVERLSAGFGNVTNSYKFYWFLAILEHVQTNQSRTIALDDLLARMVASAWYPTNYFRISLGKQDRLGQIAVQIGTHANLPINAKHEEIINTIIRYLAQDSDLSREIKSFEQYVPYRFLRPFFAQELRGLIDWEVNSQIEVLSQKSFDPSSTPCLYRFISKSFRGIEIHPIWFEYLNRNLPILTGFCLWHLVNYVQKNNPNVPNISNKLFEPLQRDLKRAKAFWALVVETAGTLPCIYSGQNMQIGHYSLDHFLPWHFVGHDLLWNIIPTTKSINSSKSDNLPDLALYFTPFAKMQYDAIQTIATSPKINLLEDYAVLLKASSIIEIKNLSFGDFQNTLLAEIAPQVQIATNMGFASQWSYPK